jgi:hypothetical protein
VSIRIGALFLAGLVNSRALGDAIIVTLPDDISVEWESKQALDSLSAAKSASEGIK